MAQNPVLHIKQIKTPEKEMRILAVDEIAKLTKACKDMRWRTFVMLAVTTGMRRGELCHLEWKDIDFKKGVVTIRNKDGWTTKSKRIRRIGAPPFVLSMLDELRGLHPYPTVFATDFGTPWIHNMTRKFAAIVKRAGIPYCTIHDPRRTFISHLSMAGVNEAVVQKIAGHACISTTLKHYTSISSDAILEAAQKLPYG